MDPWVKIASVHVHVHLPHEEPIPPAPKSSTESVRRWLTNSNIHFQQFREFTPALHKLFFFKGRSPNVTVRLLLREDETVFANIYVDASKVKAPMRIIARSHPNTRFVLWHLNQKPVTLKLPLKMSGSKPRKRSPTLKAPPHPCGFVDCDGGCISVPKEDRDQFSMDNLLDECALKGVRASQVAVSENYERNANLQYRLGPNDKISRLPFEILHHIARFCGRSEIRALARTNRVNRAVFRHFVPGLKLKLYAHQCAALDRMTEMEKRHSRKPLPLLHLVKKVNGCHIVADLVDGSLYALANMPTSEPLPRGGFLCDEPGLGKTITAIALILKTLDVRTRPPPGLREDVMVLFFKNDGFSFPFYKEDCMPDTQLCPKRSTRIMSEIISDDDATRARALQLAMESEKSISLRSSNIQRHVVQREILLSSATVIFAPRELVPHWEEQIHTHTREGSIRLCSITSHKKFPNRASLCKDFDVILVSFNMLSSMYTRVREKGETDHPMVNVRFLRVIFDEGHKLGAGTHFHDACLSVKAERRWIMTGTPMRNTPNSDYEQLYSTLRFLRESNFGLDHETWTNAIRKPCSEFRSSGLATLKHLLNTLMIRTNKKSVAGIPDVNIKTVRLGFSDNSASSYNALYRLITRNLITSDWFSDSHEQSMLNTSLHSTLLSQVIMNLRRACNTGLTFLMQVNGLDLMCSLENIFHYSTAMKHGRLGEIRSIDRVVEVFDEMNQRQPVSQDSIRYHLKMNDIPDINPQMCCTKEQVENLEERSKRFRFESKLKKHWKVHVEYRGVLVEIAETVENGGPCNKCAKFTKEPFLTPCAHVLCSECMMTDRKSCPVCSVPYYLDSFGVPEQLIELQPSIANLRQEWEANWSAGKDSVKMQYLLGKLRKFHQWNSDHRTEHPKKVILFSGFTEHLMCASIALKEDPILKSCYAEMYTNTAELNYSKSKIHEHFDKELDRFRKNRGCSVLLLGDRRGSVGLDLSFVQYVFLMEPVWDASLESQVIARAHRLGAKNTVHVERLVLKGSVEEDILASFKTVGTDRKMKKAQEESRKKNMILNLKTVQYSPVTPGNDGGDDLVIDSLEDDEPMPRDNRATPLREAYFERVSTTSPGETKSKKKKKRKNGDRIAQVWNTNTKRRIRF